MKTTKMLLSISKIKETRYMQYIAAIAATLGMATSAMYLTWPSPSLPLLTSDNSPIGVTVTSEEASWIVSSLLLGTFPGAVVSAWWVEKFGRRGSLLLAAPVTSIPWIAIAFAQSTIVLYISRFVAGIGLTVITVVCAMYNGEIAEKDIRGKLGTYLLLLKLVGSFFILTVGPFLSFRALALSCAAFPVVYAVILYFMPESPYFLVKMGKMGEARTTLVRLSSITANEIFIDKWLEEIKTTVDNDMKNRGTAWEFFLKQEYRKSLIIMLGIKTLQQFSGINAINAYMQSIIQASGSSISPKISSIIFGAIQIPAGNILIQDFHFKNKRLVAHTARLIKVSDLWDARCVAYFDSARILISSFAVDRMGRKPLILISALGCAVALAAEGTYFYLQDMAVDTSAISWLPTTAIVIFLIMNPLGIVSLPYVLLGELYPTNIKGIAVSFGIFYGGLTAFIASKFFGPISEAFGMYTIFWAFTTFCVLGAVFVFFVLPETKNKSFAAIQTKLNKNYGKKVGV